MSDSIVGFVYGIKNPAKPQYLFRGDRVVDPIKWKEHDPDEEIDLNNFPHREILGPGYDEFYPQMRNFGTLKSNSKFHHDPVTAAARSKDSFFKGTWPSNYYACMEWVTLHNGDRGRCLFTILVNSGGCHVHTSSAGFNQVLKDAQHGKTIKWRDLMDPIELLKIQYLKDKEARLEVAMETIFSTGISYQEGMKKIEAEEKGFKDRIDKEIEKIREETKVRDQPNNDKAEVAKPTNNGGRRGRRGGGANAA